MGFRNYHPNRTIRVRQCVEKHLRIKDNRHPGQATQFVHGILTQLVLKPVLIESAKTLKSEMDKKIGGNLCFPLSVGSWV